MEKFGKVNLLQLHHLPNYLEILTYGLTHNYPCLLDYILPEEVKNDLQYTSIKKIFARSIPDEKCPLSEYIFHNKIVNKSVNKLAVLAWSLLHNYQPMIQHLVTHKVLSSIEEHKVYPSFMEKFRESKFTSTSTG